MSSLLVIGSGTTTTSRCSLLEGGELRRPMLSTLSELVRKVFRRVGHVGRGRVAQRCRPRCVATGVSVSSSLADDGLDHLDVVSAAGHDEAVGALVDGDAQVDRAGALRRVAPRVS